MSRSGWITGLVIIVWVLSPEIVCLFPGVMPPVEQRDCGHGPKPNSDLQKCCRALVQPKAVVTAKAADQGKQPIATLPIIGLTIDTIREAAFAEQRFDIANGISPPLISQETLGILRI